MKYCEYCGSENEKDQVFCQKCGANLNYKAVEEHSTLKEKKLKGKRKKKVKKVTKTKKIRAKKTKHQKNQKQEVVRKMSFLQKCLMLFLILIIVVLLGVIGIFVYDTYYGVPVMVPNVVGMTYEEAYEVLTKKELEVTKVNKLTNDLEEVGIVLSQEPKTGDKTVEHARVKLMVGIEDDSYLVPNFIGMSVKDAINLLEEEGINYQIKTSDSSTPSGIPEGVVKKQSIKAGKKMRKNETITFTISEISVTPSPTPTAIPTTTPEIDKSE